MFIDFRPFRLSGEEAIFLLDIVSKTFYTWITYAIVFDRNFDVRENGFDEERDQESSQKGSGQKGC